MIQAGLPGAEAIRYFTESTEEDECAQLLRSWQRSKVTREAMRQLKQAPWEKLPLEDRIKAALDQHYAGLAYLLYSRHYAEADGIEKSKLDAARQACEARMAGNAGKMDALSRFFEDLETGKIKLNKPVAGVISPSTTH